VQNQKSRFWSASQAHQIPAATHTYFEISKLHRQVSGVFEQRHIEISQTDGLHTPYADKPQSCAASIVAAKSPLAKTKFGFLLNVASGFIAVTRTPG
jgi:hypothetical protein